VEFYGAPCPSRTHSEQNDISHTMILKNIAKIVSYFFDFVVKSGKN